jgi:hypothetical protein
MNTERFIPRKTAPILPTPTPGYTIEAEAQRQMPKPFILVENPAVAVALLAGGMSVLVGVVAGQDAGWRVAGIIAGGALVQWSGWTLAQIITRKRPK